jgi:hypothetical protein
MWEHSLTAGQLPPMSGVERAALYLECIEPSVSGAHGHNQLLYAASTLVNGFALPLAVAKELLERFNARCEPPWPESKLDRKLRVALTKGSNKGRGHLLGAQEEISAPESNGKLVSAPPLPPKWPESDLGAIDRIVRNGPGVCDVWESSPWRWEDEQSHTEEIVDIVFPGDPYLCAGWASWRFATRRRNTWRGQLSEMSLIVPNPMVGPSGLTKEGRESQHSLEATARRIYQVIEFDFAPLSRTSQPTIYAPLLEGWKAPGISTLDACAALSAHLVRLLPSWLLFLSSGGKSGHAWFNVRGLPVPTQRAFFSEAVRLGGDPQLWTRSQLCRIPDGRRENGRRQTCFYFNPENAINP